MFFGLSALLAHHAFVRSGDVRGDQMVAALGRARDALRREASPKDWNPSMRGSS
jgi:hypothetical protein